jgi:hypothetical protein
MSNELTVAAAARKTGYTRQRLYQLIDAGKVAVRRERVLKYEIRIPTAVVEDPAQRRTAAA